MYDRLTDGPYGHTVVDLRHSDIRKALQRIELRRARSSGFVPNPRKRSRAEANANGLNAAFARAAREQRELQRLKASGKPFACLDLVGVFDYDEERIDA